GEQVLHVGRAGRPDDGAEEEVLLPAGGHGVAVDGVGDGGEVGVVPVVELRGGAGGKLQDLVGEGVFVGALVGGCGVGVQRVGGGRALERVGGAPGGEGQPIAVGEDGIERELVPVRLDLACEAAVGLDPAGWG